jgi:hypothetical protein
MGQCRQKKGFRVHRRGDARTARRCVAAFAALVAALAGGCGGDDRLSREEFTRRATAICTPAQQQLRALPQPQSLPELVAYAQEARDLTASAVEQLQELRPPEELEGAYGRYLDRAERVVELLDELEAAAAAEDAAETRRLVDQIAGAAQTRALARAAGIAACEQETPG